MSDVFITKYIFCYLIAITILDLFYSILCYFAIAVLLGETHVAIRWL